MYYLLLTLLSTVFLHEHTNSNDWMDHIFFEIKNYGTTDQPDVSFRPVFDQNSPYSNYQWRFNYLLMNKSEIYQPGHFWKSERIVNMFPDTLRMREMAISQYRQDETLKSYFEQSLAPFWETEVPRISFSKKEMMEVASKFYFADQILPDTSVQVHICIGINGVSETEFAKDITLLAAFCFETIMQEKKVVQAKLDKAFKEERKKALRANQKLKGPSELYLIAVREQLYENMKTNKDFEKILLRYYKKNKVNLAFKLTEEH